MTTKPTGGPAFQNVLKFPSAGNGPYVGTWLAGYAAGLADARRSGADIEEIVRESGISREDFIFAGTDDYDLIEIKEFLK